MDSEAKGLLQKWANQRGQTYPKYVTTEVIDPRCTYSHNTKRYASKCTIASRTFESPATYRSKKRAEQAIAREALNTLTGPTSTREQDTNKVSFAPEMIEYVSSIHSSPVYEKIEPVHHRGRSCSIM